MPLYLYCVGREEKSLLFFIPQGTGFGFAVYICVPLSLPQIPEAPLE